MSEVIEEYGSALGTCCIRLNHTALIDSIMEMIEVDKKKKGN